MFAYYSSAFGANALLFDHPLLEIAVTGSTIMLLVCFIFAAEYGVAVLLVPTHLWALVNGGRRHVNKRVLVPPPSTRRVDVLKRGFLRFISDYAVDPVVAILANLRLVEIGCAAPKCVGWYQYVYKVAAMIFVHEWLTKSLKRGLRNDALLGVVETKVAPCYVKEFSNAGMS